MSEAVLHLGDLPPWNLRSAISSRLRELLDSFADDFELANDGVLPHAIRDERAPARFCVGLMSAIASRM
jgi:hypothetical protein